MKTFRIYYERDHYDIVADEWRIRGIIEDERLTQIAPFSHYFYIGDELKAYFPLNCSVEDITNELKEQKGEWYSDNETKKGEIKYSPCGKSHLLSSKETGRLRRLRKAKVLGDKKQKNYLKRMLPYG